MTRASRSFFMLRLALASTSLLALVACGSPASRGKDTPESSGASAEPVTSLAQIEGFWLVERFDDFVPSWRNNTPWRSAYVQIDTGNVLRDAQLTYRIGCNQSGNPATLSSDGILQDTSDGSRLQTLQGCAPEIAARDSRFYAFFGTDPTVRRISSERLLLSSNAGELVLVRPEVWRAANRPDFSEIEGRWVPRMATSYDGWGYEGQGVGEAGEVVSIGAHEVTWTGCPQTPIPIRWASDARLKKTASVDIYGCRAVTQASHQNAGAIMEVLMGDPAVIRTGADRISLVKGSGSKVQILDLQSEDSVLNPPPAPPPPAGSPPPPPPPPITATR